MSPDVIRISYLLSVMLNPPKPANDNEMLQAMFYLAEGKMDGNLFSQFLREAVSGSTGTWQDC